MVEREREREYTRGMGEHCGSWYSTVNNCFEVSNVTRMFIRCVRLTQCCLKVCARCLVRLFEPRI